MGILQKKCRTTGKKALAYRGKGCQNTDTAFLALRKRLPKYRYCFSCLKVRGGALPSKCRGGILRVTQYGNRRVDHLRCQGVAEQNLC